jgi:hypothetical protein
VSKFKPGNNYSDINFDYLYWTPQMPGRFRLSIASAMNFAIKQEEPNLYNIFKLLSVTNFT